MVEFFRDGGWGMYPTLFFGVLMVGVAARYALTPERRFLPLLFALGIATMSSGGLGFVTGLITTAKAVQGEGNMETGTRAIISLYGFGESLSNVAFALGFVTIAALASCFGGIKIAKQATA
ncbi:MAG: hypothetical protein JWM74_4338 [Myxococcaceae bacterium]|nr:hypothetical protein [Myxococcaceae bacterium]